MRHSGAPRAAIEPRNLEIPGSRYRAPRNDDVEKADDWADAHRRRAHSAVPSPRWKISPATPRLPKRALILLADADAFRSIGLDRRAALWAVRRLPDDVPLPLFEVAAAREQPDENAKPLPLMPLPEQVVADYQTIRLSLKGHPMEFLRAMFAQGARRRLPATSTIATTGAVSAAPAWCWCGSGRAAPRASCS